MRSVALLLALSLAVVSLASTPARNFRFQPRAQHNGNLVRANFLDARDGQPQQSKEDGDLIVCAWSEPMCTGNKVCVPCAENSYGKVMNLTDVDKDAVPRVWWSTSRRIKGSEILEIGSLVNSTVDDSGQPVCEAFSSVIVEDPAFGLNLKMASMGAGQPGSWCYRLLTPASLFKLRKH